MIVVAELGFNDGGHVPFNAGFLAVIRNAFPQEQVSFFGGSGQIVELKAQSGKMLAEFIEWQEMSLVPRDVSYFSRLIGEIHILKLLFQKFSEGGTGILLLTSVRPATLLALKLVKCFQSKDVNVQIVLHGQLSGVVGRRYRHPIRRFQEMRTALTIFGNNQLQYLVLENNLRDVLLQHLPFLSGIVEVLYHPLPPNEAVSITNHLSTPIRFGFLGLANEAKGFPVFVQLAEQINEKYRERTEFHAIGRRSSEGNPTLRTNNLITKPGVERLSRADYIQGVAQLHFIVLPFQVSQYELNSSGTLLDAMAWGKPLIARKISMFENLFAKHGDIGYLFSTDEELRDIVEDIVKSDDKARYDEQVRNIEKMRCSRSPEILAATYQNICEKMVRPVRPVEIM